MVQTNGNFEPFSRDKLFMSVYEACKHRTNPINDAAELTNTIIVTSLIGKTSGLIERRELAAMCIDTLKRFDSYAATAYEAFHVTN